jgi:hypothetical protein
MCGRHILRYLAALALAGALLGHATGCGSAAGPAPAPGSPSGDGQWRFVAEIDDFHRIAFSDRGRGWLVRSTYEQVGISDGRTTPVRRGLWATDDGGRTWTACDGRIKSNGRWEAPAPSIDKLPNPDLLTSLDRRRIVVAFQGVPDYAVIGGTGFMVEAAYSPGGVVMSRDGGRSWTTCLRLPLREVIAVSRWIDPRHGWVLSYHKSGELLDSSRWTLRRTADGGRSWQELSRWERPRDALVTCPTGLLTMVDRRVGWEHFLMPLDEGVGLGGVICRTMDGAETWSPAERLPAARDEDFPGVEYPGSLDGFQALGRDEVWCWRAMEPMMEGDTRWEGALYHTTDAGRSWVYSDISDPVHWAHFVDGRRGWMVTGESGGGETVSATVDGGLTWEREGEAEGRFMAFAPASDALRLVVRARGTGFGAGPFMLYERSIDD